MTESTEQDSSVTRSCASCPSYLAPNEVQAVFGQHTGTPMCARTAAVLGRIGSSGRELKLLHASIASTCSEFGKPKPLTRPTEYEVEVTRPIRVPVSDAALRPKSCTSCQYYLKAQERGTATALGFGVNLCPVQGRLIFIEAAELEAEACMYGSIVTQDPFTGSPELLPRYANARDAAERVVLHGHASPEISGDVDPTDFTSSIPVSDADRSEGIRAWREIHDPSGYGPSVRLPVFDYHFWPDSVSHEIPVTGDPAAPESYNDHAGVVYDFAAAYSVGKTMSLVGDAGTGKTEAARFIAWLGVMPFTRIIIRRSSTYDELFGQFLLIDGETRFKVGRIPAAAARAGVLLVDEPNAGEDEIFQSIRGMTDASREVVLEAASIPDPENPGSLITPPPIPRHKWNLLMLAMNPAWSPIYTGLNQTNAADVSRLVHFELSFPPDEVERSILQRAVMRSTGEAIPSNKLDTIMRIAGDIRANAMQGSLEIAWGVREQLKVAELVKFFPLEKCYKRALLDFLEPQTREFVLSLIRSHNA